VTTSGDQAGRAAIKRLL